MNGELSLRRQPHVLGTDTLPGLTLSLTRCDLDFGLTAPARFLAVKGQWKELGLEAPSSQANKSGELPTQPPWGVA